MATTKSTLSLADRKHGYRLGVDGFVTRREAAVRLGVTTKTVDALVVRGFLRKKKFGETQQSASRICRRSLEQYASSGEA